MNEWKKAGLVTAISLVIISCWFYYYNYTHSTQYIIDHMSQEQKTKISEDIKEMPDPVLQNELKKYMYENFGGNGNPKYKTSWYDRMTDIQVMVSMGQRTVTIKTNISKEDKGDGLKSAKGLVGAVSMFAASKENLHYHITVIKAESPDMSAIYSGYNVAEK